MSRTNPYKKKQRFAKRTILIYGEGFNEEMFLKHLRSLYSYNNDIAVTIRKGTGGTADRIVINAGRIPGAFDKKVVVLDNDKPDLEMAKAREDARNKNIELIENSPCLEASLLSILHNGKSFAGKDSSWCKSEFESKYIVKKKRDDSNEYIKIFPQALLDAHCPKVAEIKKLISFMKGSF